MDTLARLIDDIDAEKFSRARRRTEGEKIADSLEMTDLVLEITRGAARAEFPSASNEEIHRIIGQRLARTRETFKGVSCG